MSYPVDCSGHDWSTVFDSMGNRLLLFHDWLLLLEIAAGRFEHGRDSEDEEEEDELHGVGYDAVRQS